MKRDLLKPGLRRNTLILDVSIEKDGGKESLANETTMTLAANCSRLGFGFAPEVVAALNLISPKDKLTIFETLKEVSGVNKNWTPLTKQWDIPTGESRMDHVITFFANVFKKPGIQLQCGHTIPPNTFPLERYNGCPFCGTPFEQAELAYGGNPSKIKVLELWSVQDAKVLMKDLLASPVALDATQVEDLKVLLLHFDLPDNPEISMKETTMLVVDAFVAQGRASLASALFSTPTDVLRYLWFKHTGFLQIVEPKTIIERMRKNSINIQYRGNGVAEKAEANRNLKLKFSRAECKQYALWLNEIDLDTAKQCEIMHPKRNIWVRVIRALRLAEYSKRKGFGPLAELLDVFYNQNYEVWQGRVEYFKLKYDEEGTFKLLKQRPGLFARSLFSTMLWFGKDATIGHFRQIMDLVPPRLIYTLSMYAEVYFDKNAMRVVKPLGGTNKKIPAHQLLQLYTDEDLAQMQQAVQDLSLEVIQNGWRKQENTCKTMYIAPSVNLIPISIGDRSDHIQDLPGAPIGTRFNLEGDTVRLFLQWGEGMPAQHLDMDLSCVVSYTQSAEVCSYSRLAIGGCKHSGDIQRIPHMTGTAEYIDVNLSDLRKLDAKYVTFTCNSYTNGAIAPNTIVGWMDSKYPMKVTRQGVAYDPTAVQHQVQLKQSLTKGLVFGILDVAAAQVIWVEMSFAGQRAQNMDYQTTAAFIKKLDAKLRIGELLRMKADIQGLTLVKDPLNADEVYDEQWALNTARVSELFMA